MHDLLGLVIYATYSFRCYLQSTCCTLLGPSLVPWLSEDSTTARVIY